MTSPDLASGLPYRPCVGICLLNTDGLIFAGERLDRPGAWQMPQGGVDEGEDILDAAKRELREETGTDLIKIIGQYPEELFYDLPPEFIGKFWDGRYRGQRQTWIYARFMGNDSDINLALHTPPEFGRWAWLTPPQIITRIVDFKIPTYERVFDFLGGLIAYTESLK